MSNLITINQHNVAVKEYNGHRIVTFTDIDRCHNRPEGTASRNFRENRQHFIDGIDFFVLKPSDVRNNEIRRSEINNRGTMFITESGYLMLVKSFTDDLAWKVQRALVNNYFRVPKSAADPTLKLQIQQERAHAMLMNAKVRALKTIMQTVGDKHLSGIAVQVFGLTAIEEVTGQKIDYRPECGKLYSAGEIGEEIGVSGNSIGRHANAAGIKTDDYGVTVLSKSKSSVRQVPTFMYNEKGRAAVKALFEKEV